MERKVTAVIGPQTVNLDLSGYIPDWVESIVISNGKGIYLCAWKYAQEHNLPLLVIKPEYAAETGMETQKELEQKCLRLMIDCAECLVAMQDKKAPEVKKAVQYARKQKKRTFVYDLNESE